MTESSDVVATLVANRREFLAFVERRVGGDRALAEEILQDAFVRTLDRAVEIRESAVGWFYRVLRNAIIDRSRRAKVERARIETLAHEPPPSEDAELLEVACRCVMSLAQTLKPEYADALRKIDMEDMPVAEYARFAGISASNAGVRVFRAREALRKQIAISCGPCAAHGCIECCCGATADAG